MYLFPFAIVWPANVPGKYDIAGSLLHADNVLDGQLLMTEPVEKPNLAMMVGKLNLSLALGPNILLHFTALHNPTLVEDEAEAKASSRTLHISATYQMHTHVVSCGLI